MSTTTISWTDATWNPTRGCSVTSPGRNNCYAMQQAHRFSGPGMPYEGLTKTSARGPQWTGVVQLVPEKLGEPLRWRKPRRIFVNPMSDLFHESLSFGTIARIYGVMACAPRHTFQILTKRPERFAQWEAFVAEMAEDLKSGVGEEPPDGVDARASACVVMTGECPPNGDGVLTLDNWRVGMRATWPLPNVWLGVSAEDQARADERIPLLLATPAARRVVSLEPLLAAVDVRPWLGPYRCGNHQAISFAGCPSCEAARDARPLDAVIVGGESGSNARPCDLAWIRSIRDQCRAAGVKLYVKQLGAAAVEVVKPIRQLGTDGALAELGDRDRLASIPKGWCLTHTPDGQSRLIRSLRLRDRAGADTAEWPEDLRVREWP